MRIGRIRSVLNPENLRLTNNRDKTVAKLSVLDTSVQMANGTVVGRTTDDGLHTTFVSDSHILAVPLRNVEDNHISSYVTVFCLNSVGIIVNS